MSQRRSNPPGGHGPPDGPQDAARSGAEGAPRGPRAARGGAAAPPPNALFAEMLRAARELLAVRSPLDAELMVSEMLGTWWGQEFRPARRGRRGRQASRGGADIEEVIGGGLVAYAARQGSPAALALLAGIACLGTTRQAAQAEQAALRLLARGVPQPRWADQVGRVAAGECYLNRDAYGDRDEVVCVFSYAGEERHALVTSIDYNFRGMLRDGWVTSQVDKLIERGMASASRAAGGAAGDAAFQPVPPGLARRMLATALAETDQAGAPPVSDSFAAYHAFIRARIRALPPDRAGAAAAAPGPPALAVPGGSGEPSAGRTGHPGPAGPGTGSRRQAWSRDRRAMLAAEFLASDEAEDLSDRQAASQCADRIIDYGCDQDFRRPLRMSPVKVERFLLDWLPRKAVLTPEEQEAMPHVVAAWTRWAGRRGGYDSELIMAALDAIFDSMAAFARTYRGPESFGLDRALVNRLLPDGDMEALPRRTFAFPLLAGRRGGVDLAALNPADPAGRRALLAASHSAGAAPGEGRHEPRRDADAHLDRHLALADRLWRGDPPELWEAAQRLLDLGTDRHEALHVLMETLEAAGPDTGDIAAALDELPPDG